MAETKQLPPVQISAAEILEAFRQQPVVLREAQRKIDREQAAARAGMYDYWRHIRRLNGVAKTPEAINSYLHQADTGRVDEVGRPIIETLLRCTVTLENGKEITAEARAMAMLDKLITERVHAALGIGSSGVEKKPWVPLAKEFTAAQA